MHSVIFVCVVVPYIFITVGMFIYGSRKVGTIEYYQFCICVKQSRPYRFYVNFLKLVCFGFTG